MPRLLALVAVCLCVAVSYADGAAIDRPISATKLRLKRSSAGHETLTFASKDPAFLFPLFETANDPSTGTPGGARLELFAPGPTSVTFDMPVGNGAPGWTGTNSGIVVVYRFVNDQAPDAFSSVQKMLLKRNFSKQTTMVKISGKSVGLPLAGSQGPVSVRITTGTYRNCTTFGPSTIVADAPGRFFAKRATGAGIADCKAETLGGAVCGNGVLEPDEACDGGDVGACVGGCQANCTCAPVCGDDAINQPSEQCDGSAGGACPGQCLPSCTCPVCGDGLVDQPSEQCDGADDAACPSACQPNCVCLGVCGDGVINQSSEQCDGAGVGGVCGPPINGMGCRPPASSGECTCCSETGAFCADFGCCSPNATCIQGPNHSGTCCVSVGGSCTTSADCCGPLSCSAGTCGF
jgi:hypothetical protein